MRLDNSVQRVFGALFQGEVDVSEMSLAELVYYTSRGQADFVAIPVFPFRVFRHAFFFYSPSSGVRGPRDLNGRKIGFQRWVQTAAVWMRGTLVDDYGVRPAECEWYVGSTHHWEDSSSEDIQPRTGFAIKRYQTRATPTFDASCQALLDAEVDVIGIAEDRSGRLLASGRARRLFEDYRAEEASYFRRTRVFPIMHVLAMRRSLAEAHPDLPVELFRLFSQTKQMAQAAAGLSWALAWTEHYIEDERGIFEGDLWPFGLEANRHVLQKFIGYCWDQGIAARRFNAEDLFVPSTRDLTE